MDEWALDKSSSQIVEYFSNKFDVSKSKKNRRNGIQNENWNNAEW